MAICQEHYVERSLQIFVVNAPFWFAMPWKAISPLLSPNTRKKVSILGTGKSALSFGLFDPRSSPLRVQDLPPCYGGTGATPLGQSTEELELKALVLNANECHRQKAQRVAEQPMAQPCSASTADSPAADRGGSPAVVSG
eukprot:CAMPEP_0172633068 /NCGR_PEP_ID=MMETSP1068-20121228/187540_1 /TAXON_ID=35684 /ORGANISM="Pseudopedinella elastica, Strain CCMP716" /LENGTH=139 /DNA_ID=CAMNT_0013444667 /DNA_START=1 /DNA_END=417 /DNA_ORIENTATION=+